MSTVIADRPAPSAGTPFAVVSDFQPAGDQPQAIVELVDGDINEEWDHVLFGITESGR